MTLEEIEALKAPEQRPAEMSHEAYTQLCGRAGVAEPISKSDWESLPIIATEDSEVEESEVVEKADAYEADAEMAGGDESEEEEDEETEDEEAEVEDSAKSVEIGDLMKSIEDYQAVEDALDNSGTSRETYLTARLDAGTITKSERGELGKVWAGLEADDNHQEDEIQKSLIDTMAEDEDSAHLVDASDFLRTLVKGVDHRMDTVVAEVGRDGRATRELLKAQGSIIKSLAYHASQQDSVIKAMAERLETVEHEPVPRRSVVSESSRIRNRGFSKAIRGGESNNEQLSKSQIQSGLRALMIHASDKEDSGAMDRIAHATALYEQTGTLPQNVMTAVEQVS